MRVDRPLQNKQLTTSVQPRFVASEMAGESFARAYLGIIQLGRMADAAPPYGSPERDRYLRELVRKAVEPILSGAIGSMVSRFVALGWSVSGGRNRTARVQRMLSNAEGGKGWNIFVSKVVEDMLVTDRAGFVELGTLGQHGPVVDVFHLDSCACYLTGNPAFPVDYHPQVGKKRESRKLDRDHVVHLPTMPSPDESQFDLSLSAVSRALRAAQILKAINDHDIEKLERLPPQGIMTVMNITENQWQDVLVRYKEGRKEAGMSVFPGLLVLAGQSLTTPPKIELTPFSTLPEGFDKKVTVEIYVKTLALALGVDVAEIWLIPQVGATKAAFTIQHMKARGKGIGLVISMIERMMNFRVMPRGVRFEFDLPDDEQDAAQAEVEGKRILNVKRLYETQRADMESIISREEARQMLAQEGILGPEFAESEVVTLYDVAARKSKELRYPGEDYVTLDRHGKILGVVFPGRYGQKDKQAGDHGYGQRVTHRCPICGHAEADEYGDHGGLMVCASESCGCTFDPQME